MGAPFEGLWSESIPAAESLVAHYHEYHGFPRGQYTDDTQLTVATVESIVETKRVDLGDIAQRIAALWKHHEVIGPGGACTHAAEHFLATGDWIAMGAPDGQAGNGTAMRTAVLGLQYGGSPEQLRNDVASISRLTHTDSRSVAGGVAIAEAARQLAVNPLATPDVLCDAAADAAEAFSPELAGYVRGLPTISGDESAMASIAWAGQPSPEFEKPIITPFVIPTVLAALYCIINYSDSWSDSVTHAIRLGGDVDTLGAIVGSLAGIRHGSRGIPGHLVVDVQNARYLQDLAARYHAILLSKSLARERPTN
jgi:ADP-ribosylglycohydrolase